MSENSEVVALLRQIGAASPAGFAIALHVGFTAPKYLFQAYPRDWIARYSELGLVLKDPTVHWGFANTGSCRWSDLEGNDPAGVMAMAREHGLHYGVTLALLEDGSRSVASFARSDREFDTGEIAAISGLFDQLHAETRQTDRLTAEDHAQLRRMSILLTHN